MTDVQSVCRENFKKTNYDRGRCMWIFMAVSIHFTVPTPRLETAMVKIIRNPSPDANANTISPNSTWLVTFPHVQCVKPMHFGCAELVEQHSSTRLSQIARYVKRVDLCQNGMSQVDFGIYLTPSQPKPERYP